ncbi:MAG: DUF4395 domain-containing protein [Armatimonadota bacterium]|nr:DUF4395 domain-containing protein [Armatimonadota bacterium]MDR7485893.1 DUF4395 domain-containing protein [Armatimonadota bacterium]MDR7533156.1 DUF4395 domain-containing protein [Armatimonadota bacterium]MDR7536598.1 DUF4395 domain-containing protein [Armatimonadota bacterium]
MAQMPMVDQNAIKFAQAVIALWVIVAGVLNAPWLVLFLAAALATSAAAPSRSLFRWLYQRAAVPVGIVRPRVIPDDPAPHRFAQALGAGVLWAATLALFVGAPVLGWVLAGLVAVLAMLNVLAGFCAGCFVYYQLARRGWLRRARGAS